MKDNIKALLYVLAVIIVVPTIIAGALGAGKWLEERTVEKIRASHTSAVGTVIEIRRSNKGIKVLVEYYVDGVRYERRGTPPVEYGKEQLDKHLVVMYEKEDPASSRIDFTQPVITPEDLQ